jgi:hypothetical protein
MKHQFLSGLPGEYKSARQILKSQDAKTKLMEIELRLKGTEGTFNGNGTKAEYTMRARD